MSQQLDRAGVRPPDSTLLTYTGQVREVHPAEVGSTGKNKPRKIIISDNPGQYQGKTFRCWEWKEDDFSKLQVGAWVTVHYEVEPNPNPSLNGSNMISHVELATSGGGEPQSGVGGSVGNAGEAPAPANGNGSWGTPPANWASPQQATPPPVYQQAKEHIEGTNAQKDYWERRQAEDEARTLEIEAAWALNTILQVEGPDHGMTDDELLQRALQLILLKRRCASEMR